MAEQPRLPKYISLNEAAEILSISPKTVRRLIARGEIPAYTLGRRTLSGSGRPIRMKLEDVEAVLRRIPSTGNWE